jgi:hypothetical protein
MSEPLPGPGAGGDAQGGAEVNAPEDVEVEELAFAWGYGAVMQSAARLWARRNPDGALTVGPCSSVQEREQERVAALERGLARQKELQRETNGVALEYLLRATRAEEALAAAQAEIERREERCLRLPGALMDLRGAAEKYGFAVGAKLVPSARDAAQRMEQSAYARCRELVETKGRPGEEGKPSDG